MEKLRAIIVPILLLAFTGCGGDSSSPRSAESVTSSSPTSSPTPAKLIHHDEPGPAPAGAIEEVMKDIKYQMPAITAPPGRIVIHLVNKEVPPPPGLCINGGNLCKDHTMTITDSAGHILAASAIVKPGHDSVFVLDDVPAGSYLFHCSILAHASAFGMKGTLTVS